MTVVNFMLNADSPHLKWFTPTTIFEGDEEVKNDKGVKVLGADFGTGFYAIDTLYEIDLNKLSVDAQVDINRMFIYGIASNMDAKPVVEETALILEEKPIVRKGRPKND